MSLARGALALIAVTVCGACAPPDGVRAVTSRSFAPVVDSSTVALWRFDEGAGTRIADAGPRQLDGEAGIETLTGFGRFGQAREFVRTIESFVYVPYSDAMAVNHALTVEGWVYVKAFGQYELTPIAGRWTEEANQQSWLFAIGGERQVPPAARLASPGFFLGLVPDRMRGNLIFIWQPEQASTPQSFTSLRTLETQRWTHVAATFDGEVVSLWIDGTLDSQFATRGRLRATMASVLIGNYFDQRRLSGFGGDVRLTGGDRNPYYAYEGLIDELRISNVAREEFPSRFAR